MIGLANCYDRMGRTDLSRRQYEMALAVDPANTEIYSQFAQSLEAQGQRDEAARVKTELAARVVAPEAPREVPGSVPVLPPPPAQSVTVALAPPRSAPVAVEQPVGGPVRLERLSLREVALVTRPEPRWEARTVTRTATSTTIQFETKAQPAVTLLNAARVQGLAARTRAYLASRGFAGARIGDAPAVRGQSAIVYSPSDTARAERLAAQFGFALERRGGGESGGHRLARPRCGPRRRASPEGVISLLALALALADPAPPASPPQAEQAPSQVSLARPAGQLPPAASTRPRQCLTLPQRPEPRGSQSIACWPISLSPAAK